MKTIKILAVVSATAAIVAATVSVYKTMTEQKVVLGRPVKSLLEHGPATTRPKRAAAPAGPVKFHLDGVKPSAFRAIGPDSALALNARESEHDFEDSSCSLLVRELARQAVLMAARQDLGMPTRDRALREGESGPVLSGGAIAPGATALEIETTGMKGKSLRIQVTRAGGNGSALTLIDTEIPLACDARGVVDFAALTASVEALSRREFATALRNADFSAAAGSQINQAGAPPAGPGPTREINDIEKRLASLTLVSQYTAVRQAHAAIQSSGESPRLLGLLVRGYANLGQLSGFLWNASHKDFSARSLLYAQRRVAAAPGSADALRHRAYARALTGLHALALADLDNADTLGHGHGAAPAWVPLVRSLCRYDTAALSAAVANDPAQAPLASYLCFLTVEHCQSESAMMGFGKVALSLNPLCLRVLDAMCDRAGVAAGHPLTQLGPALLAQSLVTELRSFPGLPQSVRETLPGDPRKLTDPASAAAVARALVEAGGKDTAEPSWTVLGRMVQEAQFVHVWRRAHFLRDKLAVDSSDFVRANGELVAGHPYVSFLDYYAVRPGDSSTGVANQLKGLDVIDAELTESPLLDLLGRIGRGRFGGSISAKDGFYWARAHADDLGPDIESGLRGEASDVDVSAPDPLKLAKHAEVISPFMPAAIAAQIQYDWKHTAPRIEQIERESGGHPDVGAALARHYRKLNRNDDAVRVLNRYLKVAPDYWAFEMLGQCYLDGGDETAWLRTLEHALEQDDYALNHAEVNKLIAVHFMSTGRYGRAEPYALASAQSGAGWAMKTAAECLEGLGKWDESEEITHDSVLRYGEPLNWYFWCVKTGHGHLDEASALADKYVRDLSLSSGLKADSDRADYLLAQGKTDDAMYLLRKIAKETGESWAAVDAALWCAATKDDKRCDELLDIVTNLRQRAQRSADVTNRPGLFQLAKLFQACRDVHRDPELDLTKVEQLMQANESERPSMLYFTAKFLEIRNHEADARRFYTRCVATHGNGELNRVLSAMELRKRGIDPMLVGYAAPTATPAASRP